MRHSSTLLDWFKKLSSTLSAGLRIRIPVSWTTCRAALLLPARTTPRRNCYLDDQAAKCTEDIARVLLCVCVYLMNHVIMDDRVLSIWTWLIMQFSLFIPFWWVQNKCVCVSVCTYTIDCVSRNRPSCYPSLLSIRLSLQSVHAENRLCRLILIHHTVCKYVMCGSASPVWPATLWQPSVFIHLKNGTDVWVCRHLHMRGGMQNRWRDGHEGKWKPQGIIARAVSRILITTCLWIANMNMNANRLSPVCQCMCWSLQSSVCEY